jgi:hypothetical protein
MKKTTGILFLVASYLIAHHGELVTPSRCDSQEQYLAGCGCGGQKPEKKRYC